jgi:uncharacterized protein (DUF433 family)
MPIIEIIDRGRGPQLSTSRITVQDVVPMLKRNCTPEEIIDVMPVLTREELHVIQQYVRDHYDEVMEQDRRIAEREANRVTPPEHLEARRRGRAKMLTLLEKFAEEKNAQEKNGDRPPG